MEELEERVIEKATIVASSVESILNGLIAGYQDAYNKHNEKSELEYWLTVTTHKVPRPEGNKDVAYLRLERALREKKENQEDGEGWDTQLVHQEMYVFKSIQEQANPKAPWREQLYLNCIARLVHAGLEYGEVLQRWKQKKIEPQQESKIIVTNEMPKPLTPDEVKYKEWLTAERAKEGL